MTTTAKSPAQGMSQADADRFVPNRGMMLLRRDDQERKVGAIILVQKSEDRRRAEPTTATVVRLGPEDRDEKKGTAVPWSVKVGDRVVIDAYAGHDIEVLETGERLVLTGENDVLAVLEAVGSIIEPTPGAQP